MTDQQTGTLVVRITMNALLRRATFGAELGAMLWVVFAIVWAYFLVRLDTRPWILLPLAAGLVGWSGWVALRRTRNIRSRHRMLSAGLPTLQLDGLGVCVRDMPSDIDGTALAWTDCAAVVVSRAPKSPGWMMQPVRYVQFVAADPTGLQLPPRGRGMGDARGSLLELSDTAARLTWLELPGSDPNADDVVAWLRTNRPATKVVGAGYSVTDE